MAIALVIITTITAVIYYLATHQPLPNTQLPTL